MDLIVADINDLRPTMESLYFFTGCAALVVAVVSYFKFNKSLLASLLSALFVFLLAMYINYKQIDDWYSISIKGEKIQLLFKTGNVRYIEKTDVKSIQPQYQRVGTCIIFVRTEQKEFKSIQINGDFCKTSISKIKEALLD